jgi:hypothetical protein
MRCRIPGLNAELQAGNGLLDGTFLVRVESVSYRSRTQKPFLLLWFAILEPRSLAGRSFSGRLYCTPKALWKLRWFLRDFGYDTELFEGDMIEEKALRGLRGIVKVSPSTFNGRSFLNLDGFAPVAEWETVQSGIHPQEGREGGHDL